MPKVCSNSSITPKKQPFYIFLSKQEATNTVQSGVQCEYPRVPSTFAEWVFFYPEDTSRCTND